MNSFSLNIQSDELAACDDYAEWQDLREAEAIAQMPVSSTFKQWESKYDHHDITTTVHN